MNKRTEEAVTKEAAGVNAADETEARSEIEKNGTTPR